MKPTLGRIVLYRLTEVNVSRVNGRRTSSESIANRMVDGKWPKGAQAHIGSLVSLGEEFPLIITRVHADRGTPIVSGQVLLDGNDTLWVREIPYGDGSGEWHWPVREGV